MLIKGLASAYTDFPTFQLFDFSTLDHARILFVSSWKWICLSLLAYIQLLLLWRNLSPGSDSLISRGDILPMDQVRAATFRSRTRGKTLICVSLSRVLRDADGNIGVPVVKALDMRTEYESRTRTLGGLGRIRRMACASNLEVTRAFVRNISENSCFREIWSYRLSIYPRGISLYLQSEYRFFIVLRRKNRILCFSSFTRDCKTVSVVIAEFCLLPIDRATCKFSPLYARSRLKFSRLSLRLYNLSRNSKNKRLPISSDIPGWSYYYEMILILSRFTLISILLCLPAR